MATGVLAESMALMAWGATGSRRAMALALVVTTVSLIVTIAVVLSMLLGVSSTRADGPAAGATLGRQDDYALRHDWPGPAVAGTGGWVVRHLSSS